MFRIDSCVGTLGCCRSLSYDGSVFLIASWHGVRCVCVFFFKQKTAYEMRISDWSSDVCSSDLALQRDIELAVLDQARAHFRNAVGVVCRQVDLAEIGRASCRERVCQYV